MNIEIRAQASNWRTGIELVVTQGNNYGKIEMIALGDSAYVETTVAIKMNEAQVLMDDLWHAGLRPTEGTGSAGSLKATENHLSDMRKIVFQKLKIT